MLRRTEQSGLVYSCSLYIVRLLRSKGAVRIIPYCPLNQARFVKATILTPTSDYLGGGIDTLFHEIAV
jgi:hypothetical protein